MKMGHGRISKALTVAAIGAAGAGSATAIPPAVYGGPGQISGAAPLDTFGSGASGAGPVDPQAATALARAIAAAIDALPAGAGAGEVDVEAAIVFAIDQSGQSVATALAALAQVDAAGRGAAVRAALDNVRAVRGRLARGTGAIGAAGDAAGGGLPLSGLELSVAGGSSDYAG